MSVILKASTRGKSRQYADYLLHNPKNERTRVFDIRGTASPQNAYDSLLEIGAYERLTRSNKPFLQVVMNFDDDHAPSDQEWRDLIQRTEKQIGFGGQAFVGVMHTYKGKEHLHATWSRYDIEAELMKSVDHIALDLKAVRIEHEQVYNHERILNQQKEQEQTDDIKQQFKENAQDTQSLKPLKAMDEFEKLVQQLEARRERDHRELTANYLKQMAELEQEKAETIKRLGVENTIGINMHYAQMAETIRRERDVQQIKNDERYRQLDEKLVAGTLTHVWIDARQEQRYENAKHTWDVIIEDSFERHGKAPEGSVLQAYKEEYGADIYNELVKETNRTLQHRQQEEALKQAEYAQRRAYYAEQEKQQREPAPVEPTPVPKQENKLEENKKEIETPAPTPEPEEKHEELDRFQRSRQRYEQNKGMTHDLEL